MRSFATCSQAALRSSSIRTNRALYTLNQEFFRPRGLYCLVMTYDPDSRARIQEVNLASTVAQHTSLPTKRANFKVADGTTHREWQFPETAPLVFPGLDQLADETKGEGAEKKKKIAETYNYVANYWDKRATAAYVSHEPVKKPGQNIDTKHKPQLF